MRIFFTLSRTFRGLWNNKAMAAAVVLVTFVSLLFVGAAVLFQNQINNMKNTWYDKVEVSAFMCGTTSTNPDCAGSDATQDQIDAVSAFLKTPAVAPLVKTVTIESKKEALTNYKEQMGNTAWADALTEADMQVSFRIKLNNPERYQDLADELSGQPGVDVVVDQRKQLEPIFSVFNKFTVAAAGLAAVMIATALLLIPTTIRLSALSRRSETEIMRYVGASRFFIELPFILEGVVAALIGALLATASLWAIVRFAVGGWFNSSTQFIRIVDTSDVWRLSPFLIIGSLLAAGLFSWVSIRRYARV
ncbi:MAG: permease-like cell division protein FtsX [Actinomycetaceae bacterium]|nr:permease-like cell division protein FtsX [Actinomycetaceae bacterium]MDY6082396.1 permease-like cell division protein FtsX [Actinomycetaceae bacterium]